MPTGTIASVKESRGFGFIRRGDGPDLFFHRSELVDLVFDDRLTEQRVEFELLNGPRGPRAVEVRPLD